MKRYVIYAVENGLTFAEEPIKKKKFKKAVAEFKRLRADHPSSSVILYDIKRDKEIYFTRRENLPE